LDATVKILIIQTKFIGVYCIHKQIAESMVKNWKYKQYDNVYVVE